LADDLVVPSFTSNALQKKMDSVETCFRRWRLKCNLDKSEIIAFKKGGEIEDCHMMEDEWTKYRGFRYI
jgi:Reverse transcriptase (RNA-dependent DNA polymerase).